MLWLKAFRTKQKGLPDLLNYAAEIEDGVIMGKDGAFMAGWIYQGEDQSSVMPMQRNAIAVQVSNALSMLGSCWMIHNDCIRMQVKAYLSRDRSYFPDPISELIDEERRNLFEEHGSYYESVHVLVVTYLPPTTGKSAIKEMMFEEDGKRTKASGTAELERFKLTINELESRMGALVSMERLKGHPEKTEDGRNVIKDELLSYIHWALTGIRQPINLPTLPMYLDAVIGGQDFIGGIAPKVGDKHIRVVAIEGFPQESYPCILDALDKIPIPYRWSSRFIFLDAYEASAELEKYRKVWEQKERSLRDQMFNTQSGKVDLDASSMKRDTLDAQAEANSGVVRFGYYTSVVVLMDESENIVEDAAKTTAQVIRNLGFASRIETINAVEAWLGSLPGHGVQNIRRPLLNTMNLAHMLPLSSIWAGSDTNPCPFYPADSPPLLYGVADGSTPWRFNIHVGDIGHTLILGPTGSGKSTMMVLMMMQFLRYSNAAVFAFDKGYSAFVACKAVGGEHYDLAGDEFNIAFAPFFHVKTERDMAWASEWIERIVELQGMKLKPGHRSEIYRSLSMLKGSEYKTITAFQATLQDHELKDALYPYTIDGPYGQLFDAETDSLKMKNNNFSVFEMEQLLGLGERAVLPALDYLFYRIERQLEGQPTMIVLDEAWTMFECPVFRNKIREWLKVMRKANAAVVMGTQSLSDVAGSGIMDVINESCLTKIFLANPLAHEDEATILYRRLGLNETQIDIVSSMVRRCDYYYLSPLGRRRYRLDLGPVSLAFVAVSGKGEVAEARLTIEKHGKSWPMVWLEQKGVKA